MHNMDSNADHDKEMRPDDLDALLREVDASAVMALAEDLNVEERLARIKSPKAASNRDLEEAVARWSAELLVDASRGDGALIRPVDDPVFFAAVVGRPRAGLEPWPEMQVGLSYDTPQAVTVALSLPALAHGANVTATIKIGTWVGRAVLLPPASGSRDANDAEMEISGTIVPPSAMRVGSLAGVLIELTVEGR
jgi:hypothetical protein